MAKSGMVPPVLLVSPITLTCPFCHAKPNKDCMTTSGGYSVIHVQRVKAAAKKDAAHAKRRREDVNRAAARTVREATKQ